MYLLVSDGTRYLPLNHYLRAGAEAGRDLLDAERRMAAREERLQKRLRADARRAAAPQRLALVERGARDGPRLPAARPRGTDRQRPGAGQTLARGDGAAQTALRRPQPEGPRAPHPHPARLQLIVLPFEDRSTLETDRLERCPAGFAYVDPKDDHVRTVSTCAWGIHKTAIMRRSWPSTKPPSRPRRRPAPLRLPTPVERSLPGCAESALRNTRGNGTHLRHRGVAAPNAGVAVVNAEVLEPIDLRALCPPHPQFLHDILIPCPPDRIPLLPA